MTGESPAVEVLLPVHNEAASIAATIREMYQAIAPHAAVRFIVCEDGSVDDTKQVLRQLSESLPLRLILSDARKGYSRAVIDGMKCQEAEYLLCLDSDGQCDAADFAKFWQLRSQQDVAIGWRVRRADNLLRRSLSGAFRIVYRLFYGVPIHDPSCPFVLARREVVERLVPELGEMKEGFWWEFSARVYRRGFSIREIAVNHRHRAAGQTQVYRFSKMLGIGYRHFLALFKIWAQTRETAGRHSSP